MADLTSISAAFSSITNATKIAKLLRNADSSLQRAEMKLQIAELMESLADSKMNLSEVQQLIIDKEEKIKELKKSLSLKENLVFEEPFYYIIEGDKKDGPFCQKCYDGNEKLGRLHEVNIYAGTHHCRLCDEHYGPTKKRTNPTLRKG